MTDTIESLRQQLAESQLKADANARGFSDVNKKLAECQAREKMLRDALADEQDVWEDERRNAINENNSDVATFAGQRIKAINNTFHMPSDSTALDEAIKQAKREALIEAADKVSDYHGEYFVDDSRDCGKALRRMAEEL
jgi:hypothetical protein